MALTILALTVLAVTTLALTVLALTIKFSDKIGFDSKVSYKHFLTKLVMTKMRYSHVDEKQKALLQCHLSK